MTRLFPPSAALAVVIGILLASVVFADPVNPSFETGNTNGWEADAANGEIDVVEECEGCETPFSPYTAQAGEFFALLTAGDPDEFTNLTQTFEVRAGSTVSGWYFFCNDEESGEGASTCSSDAEPEAVRALAEPSDEFCDEARIAFRVDAGPAMEAVSVNACEDLSTDWTEFEIEVPGAQCTIVDFELFAGVANDVDGVASSLLGLDNILVDDSICETPTPSPTIQPTQRPNIGAGLSGLFQGQPTPLPTAPSAVAPATTAPTISPPRTGDAGLADESNAPLYGIAGAGIVFIALSAYRYARR